MSTTSSPENSRVVFKGRIPATWWIWATHHAEQVQEVSAGDDPDWEPGKKDYWVTLRPGWIRGYGENTTQFHETSLAAVKSLWYQVQPIVMKE